MVGKIIPLIDMEIFVQKCFEEAQLKLMEEITDQTLVEELSLMRASDAVKLETRQDNLEEDLWEDQGRKEYL